jgi:hypothetical protein
MSKRILLVVQTEAHANALRAFILLLYPETAIRRADTDCIQLINGRLFAVWSVEKWNGAKTCGAQFDVIVQLADLPQGIREWLIACGGDHG